MRVLIIAILFLCTFGFSCSTSPGKPEKDPLIGIWRGTIRLQEKELPFNFELTKQGDDLQMKIHNAEEVLEINELSWQGDTLVMPMHIFDAELRAVVESGTMEGMWVKNYAEDFALPFSATRHQYRFPEPQQAPATDLSGKWAVRFKEEIGTTINEYSAIGIFEQDGSQLTGTFLTPTGDYRYLEGQINGNMVQLSTFDGERAFLFEAGLEGNDQLRGTFRSGKSRFEQWTASRDPNASLPDNSKLTYLKEGYDKLAFSFPDLEGNMVSLSDPRYLNKVVIVQLFGSWCPNCMDETRFLAHWYRKDKEQEIAVIGLAFEQKDDFGYARRRVQRMIDRFDVGYDFLIAGTSDKEAAARTLPMLNHVMSFPTTLFLDKTGKVRKIQTGFSGPGTGEYYTRYIEEFNLFVEKLLKE